MDFLEGALLGRFWSDTDFETRQHKGLALFMSALFWGTILAGAFFINFRRLPAVLSLRMPWLLLFVVLFLVTPILGYFYYRLPLLLRFGALALLALKYLALFLAIVSMLIPLLHIPADFSLRTILEFFERTIGQYVEGQTETYGWYGLLLSGIVTVVGGGLALVAAIYLMVKLPQWIYRFIAWVQRIYDETIYMFLEEQRQKPRKARTPRKPSPPSENSHPTEQTAPFTGGDV